MKKLLLATLLASTSTLAMANVSGLYVQGNVGVSKLEAKEDGEKFKNNNTGYTIAVGKDTGAVRYQADYTNYGKIENREEFSATASYESKLKAQSIGLSAIYDFQPVSGVTPYVGARLGINQAKLDGRATSATSYISVSNKETKAGLGVLAGVQYTISPNLALDGNVEYNHMGSFFDSDTKLNQYGAKLGLRYNF